MKTFAIMALLVPCLCWAQGLTSSPPGGGTGKSTPLITPDANVVAHVWWPKSSLVDTKPNAWAMQGTVPVTPSSRFKTKRSESGVFSAANYYSLGTGADVLDFAGDFTICFVFVLPATPPTTNQAVVGDGVFGNGAGYYARISTTGAVTFITLGASSTTTATSTANTASAGSGVACVGRSGTNQYAKLNAGTTATTTGARVVQDTATPAKIGLFATASQVDQATVVELYATTTAWNETAVAALQAAVMAKFK